MERYICIHGHFYQPPRESPWLEAVELQDSAYPYHDWNDRITAECYGPNGASRILDGDGRIIEITNNYSRMSFNFGPTLLTWMESSANEVYHSVLAADRESRKRFSGHGSALAQCYNHMIMPLANSRDKRTQVIWGIKDFQRRFGRDPEGMWLPETAVDTQSLEALAEQGVRFTVLAPHQAERFRKIGETDWQDVGGGKIDPSRAYLARLPSGKEITLFFYDGPVSQSVAFQGLLTHGEDFAQSLTSAFAEERDWPQLVHIATDGETYGHHHRHGEMALAYALHHIEVSGLARLTVYGEFLEKHPPTHEVEIIENTSWSCAHGVERWRSDCGCNTGGHPGWSQGWRKPLREALDWLRDETAHRYQEAAGRLLRDPWAARDEYVGIINDRSPANVERFLEEHAGRRLTDEESVLALKLLELQRHAMLMYTSCGWFFDELSGIETVQVMLYARRVVELAEQVLGIKLKESLYEYLKMAQSNIAEQGDGRQILEKMPTPGLAEAGAHYAVSSLFEAYPEDVSIYAFHVEKKDFRLAEAGKTKVGVGVAAVTSEITRESKLLTFGALHFGEHNVTGGVREYHGEEAYQELVSQVTEAFSHADLPEVIRALDRHFDELRYSIRSLFRDEQRRITERVLQGTVDEAEALYRQIYEHHAPLMYFLRDLGVPLPKIFHTAAEVVVNAGLRRAFGEETPDNERIENLLTESRTWSLALDVAGLSYRLKRTIERRAEDFLSSLPSIELLDRLAAWVGLARSLPFEVDLWKTQNLYYRMLKTAYPELLKSDKLDETTSGWLERFRAVGENLSIRVE